MADLPEHLCPGCGAAQRPFLRYPWHFCRDCRGRATDGDGVSLEFGNASVSGGLIWRRVGETDWHEDALSVICLIAGRPVLVTEARFGGIVAQPLTAPPHELPHGPRTRDLSRRSK